MPPGWSATRARVLARDSWTCRLGFAGCQRHAVEVHHTQPGVEAEATLLSVCAACHRAVTQAQAAEARWRDRIR
jgi:hypothetical protein